MKSRIERRNEWRKEYRKTGEPWISSVQSTYEPFYRDGKTYQSNGPREVARRKRQRESLEEKIKN